MERAWSAVPSADELARLAERLAAAAPALAALPDDRLLAAWGETVEAFLDPASPERRAIQDDLVRTTGLSPEGLEAGLEAVLGGVRGRPVEELFAEARTLRENGAAGSARSGATERAGSGVPPTDGFALVVLASNLPALAVQPLVAALAARRPVLLKSPTAEPVFAAAFVRALTRRLPEIGDAVAAVTWPGGDTEREAPVLARAPVVVAYGGEEALADLEARARALRGAAGVRFVAYGPKTSLADRRPGCAARRDGRRTGPGRGAVRPAGLPVGGGGLRRGGGGRSERASAGPRRSPGQGAAGPRPAVAAGADRSGGGGGGPAGAGRGGAARAGSPDLEPPLALTGGDGDRGAGAELPRHAGTADGARPPAAGAADRGPAGGDPGPLGRPAPGGRAVGFEVDAPIRRAPAGAPGTWRTLCAGSGVSRIAPPGALQSPDARWHNGGRDPLQAFF